MVNNSIEFKKLINASKHASLQSVPELLARQVEDNVQKYFGNKEDMRSGFQTMCQHGILELEGTSGARGYVFCASASYEADMKAMRMKYSTNEMEILDIRVKPSEGVAAFAWARSAS